MPVRTADALLPAVGAFVASQSPITFTVLYPEAYLRRDVEIPLYLLNNLYNREPPLPQGPIPLTP